MRSLRIDEISAVDRPAQEGATALIIKRDGGDAHAAAEPYAIMREVEDGMDRLAELLKRDGETPAGALSRLVRERHPLMMSMAKNRDVAHELAVVEADSRPDAAACADRELDALAKRRAERTGETYAAAYGAVLDTPEGRRLYADHYAASLR